MKLKSILLSAAFLCTIAVGAQEPVTIQGPNGKISAIVVKPEIKAEQKVPMVIICHGFTGNKNEPLLNAISDSLRNDGIASIRFDFDGHGQSDGKFEDMTVPKEIEDAKAVYDYVASLPYVSQVGIAGHSQGGVVASMTAGILTDKDIKAVALLAPAVVLRDDALRGMCMGKYYNPHDVPAEGVELWGGRVLGRDYIRSAQTLPIYATSAYYHGPALIVHGTYDVVVPYTYGERYHNMWDCSEYYPIDGADHGFSGHTAYVAGLVANFMNKELKK